MVIIDPVTILQLGTIGKYWFYYGSMCGETPYNLQVAVALFPNISISPTTYDFGTGEIGNPSDFGTFTITNSDTKTNLQVDTVTLAGINPSEFTLQADNCTRQTIIPSGTCTCQVIFIPTSEGVKSAILHIQSYDQDTPTKDIPLNGQGVELQPTYETWSDVILKYYDYINNQATWNEVVACSQNYASP